MTVTPSVSALTSALVHQSAMISPPQQRRHAAFILSRLSVTFAALAAAPFFLAFHGAPTRADALVFAWSFAPLAAAMLAARTGRIAAAHGVAALGCAGLALSLWAILGSEGCAVAWLAVALLEAFLSGDKSVQRLTAVATGLALCFGTALNHRWAPQQFDPTLLTAFAFAYALVVTRNPDRQATPLIDAQDAAFWNATSEIMDGLVIGFDATGAVVRVPMGSAAQVGIPPRELLGRGLFECVHVADRPAFLKLVIDTVHNGDPAPARIRLRVSDATRSDAEHLRPRHVWFEMRTRRVERATGAEAPSCAVVATLRDIDTIQAHDAEITAAQSSIEEAIRSKDHFLANMSHELRTPLNAIIGFSEVLASHTLRPVEGEKQREYARIIHQSGQHLLSVVNSILDMSKIHSGTFAINPEAFDVGQMLDLSCDMVALEAEQGSVELVRDYPAKLEELVGDKRACKQIMLNLLSNAVKFTPAGGRVTLSAQPDGNAIIISVSDTGIGVAPSDLVRLGDPFFQVRSTASRPFEGTGLGLSVVRGLVGLHGGTIELESEPARGTQVKIRLPLDCRAIEPARKSAPIETLARRQMPESRHQMHPGQKSLDTFDARMKQSA